MGLRGFWIIIVGVILGVHLASGISSALTVYKYTDKDGTICVVQDPDRIPTAYREAAEKIELEDLRAEPLQSLKALDVSKIKEKGRKQVDKGVRLLSSFVRDRRFYLMMYLAGAVVFYLIVSLILNRYIKKAVLRFFIRGIFVAAFLSCAYLYYLSYLSQSLSYFEQRSNDSRAASLNGGQGGIVTPEDIVKKAKEAADKANRRIREIEKAR